MSALPRPRAGRSRRTALRVHPWIALRALTKVMRNPDDTESGARFVLALEGRNTDRLFERFRADPAGARILSEGRSLRPVLADRARLRSMPEGSLGRAYLAFVEAEDISTEGLAEITEDSRDRFLSRDTPEQRLVSDRITDLHDLWHVTTGYSRDLVGEICLIGFSYVQLGTRAYRLLLAMAFVGMELRVPGTRALIRDAMQRSKRAPWLLVEDWEALLEQPLEAVREELGVGAPPTYVRHFRVGGKLVPEGEAHGGNGAAHGDRAA